MDELAELALKLAQQVDGPRVARRRFNKRRWNRRTYRSLSVATEDGFHFGLAHDGGNALACKQDLQLENRSTRASTSRKLVSHPPVV
jgi:hypothetical protein